MSTALATEVAACTSMFASIVVTHIKLIRAIK